VGKHGHTNKYTSELLRQAEDAYQNAVSDEQAVKSLPNVFACLRNMLSMIGELQGAVAFLQESLKEHERMPHTTNNDSPSLDEPSQTERN
jgi:hypothetical protein